MACSCVSACCGVAMEPCSTVNCVCCTLLYAQKACSTLPLPCCRCLPVCVQDCADVQTSRCGRYSRPALHVCYRLLAASADGRLQQEAVVSAHLGLQSQRIWGCRGGALLAGAMRHGFAVLDTLAGSVFVKGEFGQCVVISVCDRCG